MGGVLNFNVLENGKIALNVYVGIIYPLSHEFTILHITNSAYVFNKYTVLIGLGLKARKLRLAT